ncbi:hypothetical protein RXS61_001602 [Shigella sonnei]|nr:hypothetical protein [Shigella sonnei]
MSCLANNIESERKFYAALKASIRVPTIEFCYLYVDPDRKAVVVDKYLIISYENGFEFEYDEDLADAMHTILLSVYPFNNKDEFKVAWRMARMELNRVLFATSDYNDIEDEKWEMMFKSKRWEANVNYTYEIKPNQ